MSEATLDEIIFDKDLHSSKTSGRVELAPSIHDRTDLLMHKLVKKFPFKNEKGWLKTRVPVESSIVWGAPGSDTYTYVEIRTPAHAEDYPHLYRELIYFEETQYGEDDSKREDLITMKFDPTTTFVELQIHDPAVRKRYLGLHTVDNSLGIEINDDLKQAVRLAEAPQVGELALVSAAA